MSTSAWARSVITSYSIHYTKLYEISTPGRRVYVGVGEIPRVQNGLGICVLSTSKGIMSGERAQTEKVGGELLCEIW